MTTYVLTYSQVSKEMLVHIYEWGKEDFGAVAAKRFVSLLTRDAKILKTSPYAGAREPLADGYAHEYRSLVLHSYFKFVYFVDHEHKRVHIVDIWDTRMQPRFPMTGYED